MRLLFLVMLAMFITPIRGRKLLLRSVLKEDRYFKELISSLKNLLTCLEDPIPHQVSLTRFYDLPRPWSVAASIHGANLPVLLEQGSRRGSINVLSAFPNSGDLSRFAKYLSLCPRTNPLGVFVIVYMHCHDLQIENVHGINREFYLKLGTSRVIHFCADSNSFVYISKSHNGAQEQWHIMMKTVSGFCNEQMDERKRMVQLNTGLQNLNGFRFDFVIREQHAWIDRRGEDRFGGRDPNFAILLTDYGMQWLDSSKRSNLNTMSSMDLELGLPVWRTTEQWVSKQKFRGSITATVTQSNEYLVVRKAQRVPFGLVLLLPYDWKTWSFLGGILVLFVLASTLVHRRSFLISSMLSAFFDVLEMLLTGGSSMSIHWASQHIIVLCAIFLHILAGNAYTGLLLGFITNPQYFMEINSIKDVVATHERLYMPKVHADTDFLDRLGKLKNNLIFIQNVSERDICVRDIIMTGKAATLMSDDIYWVTSRYRKYREEGRIVLHKVKEPLFSPDFAGYVVPRTHLILDVINKVILRLWQSGLFDHWEDMLAYSLDLDGQTDATHLNVDEPCALEINQLSGPFFLFVGGMSLAGIAFLLEQVRKHKIQ